MIFDVCSYHGLRATKFDAAITADDVVITDAVRITTGAMPLVDLLGAAGLVGPDG